MSNLISIFLILTSIGVFFGYINPTYGGTTGATELQGRSIRELKEEQGRYVDALQKTKEIEQARTGLLEQFARIPANGKERLEKLLPGHIDSVRLIIDINNIAAQYGMTLKNISLDKPDTAAASETSRELGPLTERFKAVGLKFSVEGSYDNFRSFVRDLEQSLRLVNIDTISFSSSEEVYGYSIGISTYHLNADSTALF